MPELTIRVTIRVVSRLFELFLFVSPSESKYFFRLFFIESAFIKININNVKFNNRMQPIGTITVVTA